MIITVEPICLLHVTGLLCGYPQKPSYIVDPHMLLSYGRVAPRLSTFCLLAAV
ncbi:hypothetical protein SCLCIDRAFT_1220503 [Scleroderma citrinum Foug A]|uniref:Uncharacterized protein n=1 Tax=Scleroderma citrinum Foug A TaxID=1036808 RepID=A0A0C2ZUQ1_9AGAM|nr:hypothetical protein SCLCIDRAFT_1220503 [Scleroderma citrinum Foug A]